jgi:tetratricopeptide (TPR) repeat protein
MDDNPAKAIEEARSLPSDKPVKGVLYIGLKAGVLIDAGSSAKNKQAIEEGVTLFRKLLSESPEDASLHYNLGNGLAALADQYPSTTNTWYLNTANIRSEARGHLQKAISAKDNASVRSTALTNLGNALLRAHRRVEACDAYSNALKHDRTNSVASTGAARVLLSCVRRGMGNRSIRSPSRHVT